MRDALAPQPQIRLTNRVQRASQAEDIAAACARRTLLKSEHSRSNPAAMASSAVATVGHCSDCAAARLLPFREGGQVVLLERTRRLDELREFGHADAGLLLQRRRFPKQVVHSRRQRHARSQVACAVAPRPADLRARLESARRSAGGRLREEHDGSGRTPARTATTASTRTSTGPPPSSRPRTGRSASSATSMTNSPAIAARARGSGPSSRGSLRSAPKWAICSPSAASSSMRTCAATGSSGRKTDAKAIPCPPH